MPARASIADSCVGVAAIRDSDAWHRKLAVMAQFHRYSFRNQLLIGLTLPDGTGFKTRDTQLEPSSRA